MIFPDLYEISCKTFKFIPDLIFSHSGLFFRIVIWPKLKIIFPDLI